MIKQLKTIYLSYSETHYWVENELSCWVGYQEIQWLIAASFHYERISDCSWGTHSVCFMVRFFITLLYFPILPISLVLPTSPGLLLTQFILYSLIVTRSKRGKSLRPISNCHITTWPLRLLIVVQLESHFMPMRICFWY